MPFVSEDAPAGTVFSISRDEKHGGPMHFPTYDALREAFEKREVHPKDLKSAVADALVSLLDPIRKQFEENTEWQEVTKLAYPSQVPEKKKKKVNISPRTAVRISIENGVGEILPSSSAGQGKERESGNGKCSDSCDS